MKRANEIDAHFGTGRAASEIIHPTQHQTRQHHQEPRRQTEHNVNVLHGPNSEMVRRQSISSIATVPSDELNQELMSEHRETLTNARKPRETFIASIMKPNRLKREPFQFQNHITYNVESPHRAVLQMQRLMGTTKAHLNDPEFVAKLQHRIWEEEDYEVRQKELRRLKVEFDRMKKLVVDGTLDASLLPPDLKALNAHPACKARELIKRLEASEKSSTKIAAKITPLEPYEFNGDKFFKHLHKTGNADWLPKRARKYRNKASKAKSPKLPKETPLRTLFKRPTRLDSDSNPNIPRELQISSLPSSEFGSSASVPFAEKYELPEQQELKRFLQEQIMADARERLKREQERKYRELAKEKLCLEQKKKTVDGHSAPSSNAGQTPNSFEQLLTSLGVSDFSNTCFQRKSEDEWIIKYIEEAQDANELFGNSDALNRLYAREAAFVDRFLPTLHTKILSDG